MFSKSMCGVAVVTEAAFWRHLQLCLKVEKIKRHLIEIFVLFFFFVFL